MLTPNNVRLDLIVHSLIRELVAILLIFFLREQHVYSPVSKVLYLSQAQVQKSQLWVFSMKFKAG